MVQVSCSVGRISRLDSRLAYQSSPLNGRTTSFLRSINTVFIEIVRVSVLRLFDRSIDRSQSIEEEKYQDPIAILLSESNPDDSIERANSKYTRYTILGKEIREISDPSARNSVERYENRRGWERNERDPLSPPLEGGSAAPSSSFPRQSEPKRSP